MNNHKVAVETSHQANEQVNRWVEQIQAAQKEVARQQWLSFLIGGLGPFIVTLIFWLVANRQGVVFCLGLTASMGVWAVVYVLWPGMTQKRAVDQITADIQRTCEAEGLSKVEVVQALAAQAPKGGVRQAVLTTVDAETATMIDIRERGLAFFEKTGAAKEEDALKFRELTLDCLSHKLHVEAIAALGVMSTIYAEVAPPFDSNVDVDNLIRNTYNANQRVQLATRKVLSSFDFESDLKAILDTSTKQRNASLLNILLAAQKQGTEATTALAEASEGFKPLVRDEIFVGACIDYLGKHATQKIQALRALALIPDIRALPYLLKVFDVLFFYPQGIDALSRLGESVQPQLLEALRTGSLNRRYNVALALGIMEVDAARPIFTELLNTLSNPVERIGCYYGLVKLGETERLDEIIQILDHQNGDVRHTAVIALEHLSQPLPDAVYLRHLTDANQSVRLRLARKLGSQGTDNPALIEALIARLGDSEENVRAAAVDAVVKLGTEKVYDQMVKLATSGTGTTRDCAYQALGRLSDPRAEPLLVKRLQKSQSVDERRIILAALADIQAVSATEQIGRCLKDDKLSGAAFWALLRLGSKDHEAATKALQRHKDLPQRFFGLTIMGDEKAKGQLKGMISSSTNIQTLLQVNEYARILSNPDFETPLRKLLSYSNQQFTPTDKYVPYAAFKALIHTLLAKA